MSVKHMVAMKDGIEKVELTPVKAIRLRCLDCCCWNQNEVRLCAYKSCALFPYRMGRKPAPVLESGDFGDNEAIG